MRYQKTSEMAFLNFKCYQLDKRASTVIPQGFLPAGMKLIQ